MKLTEKIPSLTFSECDLLRLQEFLDGHLGSDWVNVESIVAHTAG